VGDEKNRAALTRASSGGAVDAFIDEARRIASPAQGTGRLIFALDATMSRQPSWDLAQSIQKQMFDTTAGQGALDVQLVYFRGFGECRASHFVSAGEGLAALMAKISCRGGATQIGKVLRHARDEARARPVGALIYIGDAMEENADTLCSLAGEMGLLGVKAFVFQEGQNRAAEATFREMARLSGGAYAAFDAKAPQRLAELLKAVAAYAVGGRLELERRAEAGENAARLLLSQMK
jgi:hypothetical protein